MIRPDVIELLKWKFDLIFHQIIINKKAKKSFEKSESGELPKLKRQKYYFCEKVKHTK